MASLLLIDDDPHILTSLARYFERHGWDVLRAATGEAGLQLHERQLPELVVLDLGLPGMSGIRVLEVLVARAATVIVLTGRGDVATAVEAMRIGAENFLTKPIDHEHLTAALERALEKVELRKANRVLTEKLAGGASRLGRSPRMLALAEHIELLAASDHTTVLLLGESGTGKGWVAQMLHSRSARGRGPFVELNCAGLSANFLDSELFGHEQGAFTDAKSMKRGLFEVAHGGTLFLDEIGDLAPELQPKLLKVLERKTFRRLGGTREITVDVRLVAATNRELTDEVRAGRFREDLYYRLNVLPVKLPPLRERGRDDLLALVHNLLGELRVMHPRGAGRVSLSALQILLAHSWPGNVRELRNALERALVLSAGAAEILPEHLPSDLRLAASSTPRSEAAGPTLSLDEIERIHIERALALNDWNKSLTAEQLGISRTTLHNKIRSYGLKRSAD